MTDPSIGPAPGGVPSPGPASLADQADPAQPAQPERTLLAGLPAPALPAPPAVPPLSLPVGGGAIRGIGEKFSVSSSTGTASLSLPVPASPGRGGTAPELALEYDSGSGNGVFGFGWRLSVPAITRKTDKGIPRYDDAAESDVFILSGAEDLVPVLGDDDRPRVRILHADGVDYEVKLYRPRVEGLFARIERWTSTADGQIHWRSITRDNVTSLYGISQESTISHPDPDLPSPRIFSWLLAETFDDKGNHVVYRYWAEDETGVDTRAQNEANRPQWSRRANRYLKSVLYANKYSRLGASTRDKQSWLLEIVLDYGDHDAAEPAPKPSRPWPSRVDPFSTYRAGFEIRTYRLCQRILVFHHFPDEPGIGTDCMVRSLELGYQAGPYSYLTSIASRGWRRRPGGGYLTRVLPPLELTYSAAVIDDTVHTVDPGSARNLPAGVDGSAQRWIDLDGEGIPGVLSELDGWWSYKPNLGRGRLAPSWPLRTEPAIAAQLGRQEFLDLASSGRQDLVQLDSAAPGYHERTIDGEWGSFRTFSSLPEIEWNDPDLRFADLTGDGLADVMITGDDAIIWSPSRGRAGFGPARRTGTPIDETAGPRQVFANGDQTLFLADMTGDGLSDLVRIRNGQVCYWPNLGYGQFARRVEMDRAPVFDTPEAFDASRLRLADVDGSGTTDIIYLGHRQTAVYLNRSGNAWAEPRLIAALPLATDLSTATVTDLLGTGTACIVWSSPLPIDAGRALRYLDLNGGRKPHLLTRIANNLGAETRIGYAPSTQFLLADKEAGTPWATTLPFCVHVVDSVETWDWIGRTRHRTRYRYHHGYFDGVEREFRGFGLVEQVDSDQLAALGPLASGPAAVNIEAASFLPPVVTKIWYHTGAPPWELRRLPSSANRASADGEALADARKLEQMLRDGVSIPAGLPPADQREAFRSLHGSVLREEILALDGSARQGNPYIVNEQRYAVRCCQRTGPGRHGIFFSYPTETLTRSDERNPVDPQLTQTLTIEVNDFGGVMSSAVIAYGRTHSPAGLAAYPQIRTAQQHTLVTYTEVTYTNVVCTGEHWRIPLPAESRTWEITGLSPPPGRLFSPAEVAAAARDARSVPYEAQPGPGVQRRLFEHRRVIYRRDDLSGPLPLGRLEPLGLVHQGLRLALTAGLTEQVFRGRVELWMLRAEGGYRPDEQDGWWAVSGTVSYAPADVPPPAELAEARRHFFLPRRFTDPFGNISHVRYDRYDLTPIETRDPVGNVISVGERDAADRLTEMTFDYRVMLPMMIMDTNRNRSSVCFDALAMVAATAVAGKPGQQAGDSLQGVQADLSAEQVARYLADPVRHGTKLLGQATARYVYDPCAYQRTRSSAAPSPAATAVVARETHVSDLLPGQHSRLQHALAYSDGYGRSVQRKALAERGPVTDGGDVEDRWVTSGWTIFNNKGMPVRQYEPFFSDRPRFEFAVTAGVSPVLIYDPLCRLIATLHPDHSWEKVVYGAWDRQIWDRNDTVLDRPDQDPDIGGFVATLSPGDYLPTWYEQRAEAALGAGQLDAAEKAAVHARTPSVLCFDARDRTVAAIVHNRVRQDGQLTDAYYVTMSALDIQGNIRAVTDPLGRRVLDQDYGLLSVPLRSESPDGGEHWALYDTAGQPIRSWTARGFSVTQSYDALRRPTSRTVSRDGGPPWLAEVITYGEDAADATGRNLRGVPYARRDSSGITTTTRCDFKGNIIAASRQFTREYRADIDWSGDPALEPEQYPLTARFDALNRPIAVTTPDGSITRRTYNQRSLLQAIEVQANWDATAIGVVDDIRYDAKAQRTLARYRNGAVIRHSYDPDTFRLIRTRTTRRPAGPRPLPHRNGRAGPSHHRAARPGAGKRLQDLRYAYDPIGNVTRIEDRAQQTIFFANQVASPEASYTYDATYRLIEATGREHRSDLRSPRPGHEDIELASEPLPGDGQAMRGYRESYQYNAAGNLERLVHRASGGDWTRMYHYDQAGSAPASNRVTSVSTGQDRAHYGYDHNGNITEAPHLSTLSWDWRDRLRATAKRGGHRGPVTYYQYDTAGPRARKVTDSDRGHRRCERLYLEGCEIYREFSPDGEVILDRHELQVADGAQVLCRIQTTIRHPKRPPGSLPERLHRYQLDNHLGSSCVEIDKHAAVITYEEYYPWGGSSWRAGRSRAETSLKRYRFSGKERDDETGFYYFGARYYLPWLGRWASPDPSGLADGTDVYAYARDNPVCLVDPAGTDTTDPDQTTGPAQEDLDAGAAPPSPPPSPPQGDQDAGGADQPPQPYVNEAGETVYPQTAEQAQQEHSELQEGGAAPQELATEGYVPTVDNADVREAVHKEVVIGAKAAVRHDPILGPAVVVASVITYQFSKEKGQALLSAIDGPEPESEVAQASEEYTALGIGLAETLITAGLGKLAGPRGMNNPFSFTEDLEAMGNELQTQVNTVNARLQPFKGVKYQDIYVPYQTQIAGATTVVGGEQRTVVTFSNQSAHKVFARGFAELPAGMQLGPPPPPGRLPEPLHVERTAVGELTGKFGAKAGLVTTSGGACCPCSQVWRNGEYPTWLHLKWQSY